MKYYIKFFQYQLYKMEYDVKSFQTKYINYKSSPPYWQDLEISDAESLVPIPSIEQVRDHESIVFPSSNSAYTIYGMVWFTIVQGAFECNAW